MSNAKRRTRTLAPVTALVTALVMALSGMALSGCGGETGSRTVALEPSVSSPAVATEGILRVGVNTTQAPYAGIFEGEMLGIDVDVAAALAEELGLKLELVDTAGQSADELLTNKAIDIVMDVEQTGGTVIQGTQVGPYLQSGPALFTIVKSEVIAEPDLQSLAGTKVAAQQESLSAWSVDELIGSGTADPRESLAEALQALESGEVTYAAADAVKGSYLSLDYQDVACVKMLGTPIPVYLGVASDNTQLSEALTTALRTIRDNGKLKVLLTKWLGPVSATVVMGDAAVVSQEANASTTPTIPEGQTDTGEDLPDPANAGSDTAGA